MYRRIVTLFTACMIVSSAAVPAKAEAPTRFSCRYTFSAWTGGFTADLSITNNGPTVDGWTARWTFDAPTRATSVWSATLVQTGPHDAVATPMPWNRRIPSGSMVTFGWTATAPETEIPEDITVNGLPC